MLSWPEYVNLTVTLFPTSGIRKHPSAWRVGRCGLDMAGSLKVWALFVNSEGWERSGRLGLGHLNKSLEVGGVAQGCDWQGPGFMGWPGVHRRETGGWVPPKGSWPLWLRGKQCYNLAPIYDAEIKGNKTQIMLKTRKMKIKIFTSNWLII